MSTFIHGGLGNQLFQFAVAHENAISSNGDISLLLDTSARKDRPFDLQELIRNCDQKIKIGYSNPLSIKLKRKVPRYFSKFINFEQEAAPFEFENKFLIKENKVINYGYFQNWRYVEASWENLKSDFQKVGELIDNFKFSENEMQNTAVVHIRRGDMINSLTGMGALSSDYYQECVTQIKSKFPLINSFIGVTDDVRGSQEIANRVGIQILLGPKELTAWQTIIFMSKAKVVVAANSTFSWWGAFLSVKNGGHAYIPDPWFLNWPEEIGDAFMHPEMEVVKSSFEHFESFDSDYKVRDFK